VIKPYPKIDNFILIKYQLTDTFDKRFTKQEIRSYLAHNDFLFFAQINRIRQLYPSSKIHVISNLPLEETGFILHETNMPDNWTSKFQIYSLLKEPAMYLDGDVVLLRPFENKHLETKERFNCYTEMTYNYIPRITNVPNGKTYNAGVIWIPRPQREITQELQAIHNKFFNREGFILNDEYSLGVYTQKHDMKMNLFPEVNVCSESVQDIQKTIKQAQSVHYRGVKSKEKLLTKDLRMFPKNINRWLQFQT
jgi:hypothetical protein